ncbi:MULTISPECIES: phosphate ABC transporter permease subunit PstC [Novosphingobium]|uniref:Phosphate transport system permease protein n=1 Tax=Novosphingobium decolorationis TaxID=2698673 RepID=A0ABX8EB87_9SPHN|nr:MULTISPECIES: phosphate ABC transporter permease subunit PstC [Novosphingobium]MED5544516.1 phosphate ABC transporter permease subunit PstC [Pseudomonadota bacterium]QVM85466.1 phosphate ABC transporter permease subunit PstC [Novosphingobium decolorationis]
MILTGILLAVVGLGLVGWFVGRGRARLLYDGRGSMHSMPNYHGWHLALWIVVPALVVWAVWSGIQPGLVEGALLADPAAAALPDNAMHRSAIISQAYLLANDPGAAVFASEAQALAAPLRAIITRFSLIGALLVLIVAFTGGAYGFTRIRARFEARTQVERVVMGVLLLASLMAILTTFGIVASLVFEAGLFFKDVSPIAFLTGTHWSPGNAMGADIDENFGAVPLFWGTIYIGAIIAMAVAIPLGLMSAVYLTQYASRRVRKWLKPILEILAGIPTVVYGYFAALTVAPMIRDFAASMGAHNPSTESALAAGLVMGVMIIPFVSSMADDALAAVPRAMSDGSLALGATRSETIKKVLLPAALPGIVAGVMLAISRAIGETMIVVMAAGAAANLSANPLDSMTTVTFQIVQLLTGDQEFNSPKTLSAFALGLILFIVTLVLNIIALRVVKRFREAYE